MIPFRSFSISILVAVLGMSPICQCHPNIFNYAGATASGAGNVFSTLGMSGDMASDVLSGTVNTFRAVGDGVHDLFTSTWRAGAETGRRFGAAVQNTAQETTLGFRDAAEASKTYFADGLRAGGRFASGALSESLDVARGAVGATGQYLGTLAGAIKNGVGEIADRAEDFAGEVIDKNTNFIGAATGVAENIAVRGIENFAHVLVPSRF